MAKLHIIKLHSPPAFSGFTFNLNEEGAITWYDTMSEVSWACSLRAHRSLDPVTPLVVLLTVFNFQLKFLKVVYGEAQSGLDMGLFVC